MSPSSLKTKQAKLQWLLEITFSNVCDSSGDAALVDVELFVNDNPKGNESEFPPEGGWMSFAAEFWQHSQMF